MHGKHQRRREGGEVEIAARVVAPLLVRAGPAERRDPIELPAPAGREVPHGRDIRDQSHDQEHGRHGEVRADRELVPDQRRFEIRPEAAFVGIWDQPVEIPLPSDVYQRKQPRRHDREYRHRFRGPVHGRAPPRSEEEEDRRDQRPRVGDAHPEDEAGDKNGPIDGMRVPGQSQSVAQQKQESDDADAQQTDGSAEQEEVPARRRAQRARDRARHVVVGQPCRGPSLSHDSASPAPPREPDT